MPPKSQNRIIWELTKFDPVFVILMFLMLMREHFFAMIGGTHFRISGSPIVLQLLTIMSDTRTFPFFNRNHILQMLTMYGATLHLVRALCCPKSFIQPKTKHMFMRLIL